MSKKVFVGLTILIILGVWAGSIQAQIKDGTLIRAKGHNEVYVLENGLRRWITNPDVFNGLAYKWSNVQVVSEDVVNTYPLGNDLTSSYSYPEGSLLKGDGPEVYLIEAGKKRWIPNPQIFEAKGFEWESIIKVSQSNLNYISRGDDISSDEKSKNPNTFISEGPCQQGQDTIPTIESSEVTFKFSGTDALGQPDKDLSFETFLQGFDKSWQTSYGFERKTDLAQGSGNYTFYVRAKNKAAYYDKTPAFCSFKTQISSYKDKISIYSVSGWGTDPNYESITLGASYSLSEPVNITGWSIETPKRTFIIPQGVKMFNPESVYNHKADIYLGSNERITIYGGKSPIQEDAFAVNKCWWQISDSEEYKTCYYDHNWESDFLTGEWRVYLNRSSEMFDNTNETINLLDKNGPVVDTYSY
jgi:hypothetical protein